MVLPGSSIGRYLVKRKLAEGGMAELYLCTAMGPEGFEKEVVIKRIKAFLSGDPSFIEMFKAEARLASRLNHANVVQIFDFDKHEDAWFIAMEYVYGASLWDLRRRCRELAMPFPPILVAEIGAQVARGLQYAHTLSDKGKPLLLVHRDVTPHNVLLSFDGGVKLTDFGIAKAGTSMTAPGMLKGKFAYMSPEQARGEKVDARTDVFALGITLWEMLTGGRLFEGDSDIAVLRAVQESLIAPPARLNPDVPVELSEVVLKALNRPLEQRFQSAAELDRALANFVLKNSTSTEESNVGLFLRQMFRDELEEAERAMGAEHMVLSAEDKSQTPIVDAYALGDTRQFNRHGTEQTATPIPKPVTRSDSPERPNTEQMPGLRPSMKLAPLMDEDQTGSSTRTDQMQEFQQHTQQQPGIRPSKRLPAVDAPAETRPSRRLSPVDAPDAAPEVIPPRAVGEELPKKTLLPWILAAGVAAGLVGGLAFAVSQAQPTPAPALVADAPKPSPHLAETRPPPPPQKPAELAAALSGPPALAEEPPAPVAVAAPEVQPVEPAAAPSAKPSAEPAATGFLSISAFPFAELSINKDKYEVNGVRRFSLPPGNYHLSFVHPRKTWTKAVAIKSGQTVSVKFNALESQ